MASPLSSRTNPVEQQPGTPTTPLDVLFAPSSSKESEASSSEWQSPMHAADMNSNHNNIGSHHERGYSVDFVDDEEVELLDDAGYDSASNSSWGGATLPITTSSNHSNHSTESEFSKRKRGGLGGGELPFMDGSFEPAATIEWDHLASWVKEHGIFLKAALDLLQERDKHAPTVGMMDPVVLKAGPLKKASILMKGIWKVKYVEIRRGMLSYYENLQNEDKLIRKDVPLQAHDCTVRAVKVHPSKAALQLTTNRRGGAIFEVVVGGAKKLWMASSRDERQSWMQTIRNATVGGSLTTSNDHSDHRGRLRMVNPRSPYRHDLRLYLKTQSALRAASSQAEYVSALSQLQKERPSLQIPVKWIAKEQEEQQIQQAQQQMQGAEATSPADGQQAFVEEEVDRSIEQLWRDLQRDSVAINGKIYRGDNGLGPQGIMGALAHRILQFSTTPAPSSSVAVATPPPQSPKTTEKPVEDEESKSVVKIAAGDSTRNAKKSSDEEIRKPGSRKTTEEDVRKPSSKKSLEEEVRKSPTKKSSEAEMRQFSTMNSEEEVRASFKSIGDTNSLPDSDTPYGQSKASSDSAPNSPVSSSNVPSPMAPLTPTPGTALKAPALQWSDFSEAQALTYARDILLSGNRTRSGGDSYFCINALLQHPELVVVVPSYGEVNPVKFVVTSDEAAVRRNDKAGWIKSRNKLQRGWKKLFCVLSEGILSYYERALPRPNGLRGQLHMSDAVISVNKKEINRKQDKAGEKSRPIYAISIFTNDGKERSLAFDSVDRMLDWAYALECVAKVGKSGTTDPARGRLMRRRSSESNSDAATRSQVPITSPEQATENHALALGMDVEKVRERLSNLSRKVSPSVCVSVEASTDYKVSTTDPDGDDELDTWALVRTSFQQSFRLTGGPGGRILRGEEVVRVTIIRCKTDDPEQQEADGPPPSPRRNRKKSLFRSFSTNEEGQTQEDLNASKNNLEN
uniref:PH domain-containing protein n=1 Tax=Amphora coffeiformis TaxID=265554 RepID=A0A7S3LA09_9STRA